MAKKNNGKKGKKPRVGIFSLTSCSGCQMRILDLEDVLLELLSKIDLVAFPLAKDENDEGPLDIAIVEGAVVQKEEISKIKHLRERAKILIALGTCATYGGVPSIKDFGYKEEIEEAVYPDSSFLGSIDVYGIAHYVDVDYYIRGCPPEKLEILKVLKYLLVGNIPRNIQYPVCFECRLRENECFIVDKEKMCMGPLTHGGCNAPCPSFGVPCYGCRGPLDDSNPEALIEIFRKEGFSEDDLKRMFIKFAGTSKKYLELRGLHAND
ncbi:MAG: oxidoreductase [Candidatus Altiarchaeota archaeon]